MLRPGLNPQTWVPEASMLTTRPRKPSCLYVSFFGLHVSVTLMTIIRSVRAKEIAMQQRLLKNISALPFKILDLMLL